MTHDDSGGLSPGMVPTLLLLLDGHRSPRLEANAERVMRCSSQTDPEILGPDAVAWVRQRLARIVVAGPGAERIVDELVGRGLPAEQTGHDPEQRAGVGEPAAPIDGMDIVDDVLALVGGTPMVRLDRLYPGTRALVLGKLESANPGGSVKDRVAVSLVDAAERDGRLLPGGHIVEPTSGNTGVGLAIVAARRGYRCTFTVPDKVAPEKIALLRAYGATVVVCPTNVDADDERSYYSMARAIAAGDPTAFRPDQYSNPANPAAHVAGTGPEIWKQTAGRITHFVAGAGTGGTVGGIGRYLKARNADIEIVAADPVGSVYSGGSGEPYLVEGIGEDFWPGNWDADVVDRIVAVDDADSFAWTRRAARDEGLLVGASCGAALAATAAVAAAAEDGDVIVVLLPDGGRGYLSKVYNDDWMRVHGFLDEPGDGPRMRDVVAQTFTETPSATLVPTSETDAGTDRRGHILHSRDGRPALVHAHPGDPVSDVAAVMAEFRLEELPILSAENPRVPAQVIGSVDVAVVARARINPGDPIGAGREPLPFAGMGERLETVLARLGGRRGVVVNVEGRPTFLLSVVDLLLIGLSERGS